MIGLLRGRQILSSELVQPQIKIYLVINFSQRQISLGILTFIGVVSVPFSFFKLTTGCCTQSECILCTQSDHSDHSALNQSEHSLPLVSKSDTPLVHS